MSSAAMKSPVAELQHHCSGDVVLCELPMQEW